MKNSFSLSIPETCSQKWENFTPAAQGGFCSTCSKVVVDFTKMTDAEVLRYFNDRPTSTCGRFSVGQLKIYSGQAPPVINPGMMLLKAGVMSLLFVLISRQVPAQDRSVENRTHIVQQTDTSKQEISASKSRRTIRGIVRSQDDQNPMAGVNVYLKDSDVGTTTDPDGRFEFPRKLKEGDVLAFSFIGFETKEFEISARVKEIEIPMITLQYQIMGAVAVSEVYDAEPKGLRKWWGRFKAIF